VREVWKPIIALRAFHSWSQAQHDLAPIFIAASDCGLYLRYMGNRSRMTQLNASARNEQCLAEHVCCVQTPKKRPDWRAISATDNRPNKRNSDDVQYFGVRLKRMPVLSLRRERTLNTLRFSFRAGSASLIVPNRAYSAGIQAQRFSQHCGIFKEWRFNCTASRWRPRYVPKAYIAA
jgi:hypothetical protein